LSYTEEPDYDYCIRYLENVIGIEGGRVDMIMDWSIVNDTWKSLYNMRMALEFESPIMRRNMSPLVKSMSKNHHFLSNCNLEDMSILQRKSWYLDYKLEP
jgi:hypothetical protein